MALKCHRTIEKHSKSCSSEVGKSLLAISLTSYTLPSKDCILDAGDRAPCLTRAMAEAQAA